MFLGKSRKLFFNKIQNFFNNNCLKIYLFNKNYSKNWFLNKIAQKVIFLIKFSKKKFNKLYFLNYNEIKSNFCR